MDCRMELFMRWRLSSTALLLGAASLFAQAAPQAAPPPAPSPSAQVWTWDNVKDRFRTNNPTLLAGFLNIDELKAQEITANLRPNPDFTFSPGLDLGQRQRPLPDEQPDPTGWLSEYR